MQSSMSPLSHKLLPPKPHRIPLHLCRRKNRHPGPQEHVFLLPPKMHQLQIACLDVSPGWGVLLQDLSGRGACCWLLPSSDSRCDHKTMIWATSTRTEDVRRTRHVCSSSLSHQCLKSAYDRGHSQKVITSTPLSYETHWVIHTSTWN